MATDRDGYLLPPIGSKIRLRFEHHYYRKCAFEGVITDLFMGNITLAEDYKRFVDGEFKMDSPHTPRPIKNVSISMTWWRS